MGEPHVLYTVEGGVAVLSFNRPDKKNAFSPEMVELLYKHFQEVQKDDAVQGVILTGKGDALMARPLGPVWAWPCFPTCGSAPNGLVLPNRLSSWAWWPGTAMPISCPA